MCFWGFANNLLCEEWVLARCSHPQVGDKRAAEGGWETAPSSLVVVGTCILAHGCFGANCGVPARRSDIVAQETPFLFLFRPRLPQIITGMAASPCVKSTPIKGLQKVSDRQMKLITTKLDGNVELQLLVLTYLEDLEANRTENKSARKRKAPAETLEDDDIDSDAPGFTVDPTIRLNKHCAKYSGWKRQLICELLAFVEPKQFGGCKKVKLDSISVAKQLMEFAFDLVVCDEKSSDKPTDLNKKNCFQKLFAVYVSMGRRLRRVEFSNGFVDWSQNGHFSVEDARTSDGRVVRIYDKFSDKSAVVPSDLLAKQNPSFSFRNKDIQDNYAYDRAVLSFPDGQDLPLTSLFPNFKRKLTRNMSNEVGATAPKVGDEPVAATQTDVKAQSSGAPSGAAGRSSKASPKVPMPPPGVLPRAAAGGAKRRKNAKSKEDEPAKEDEDEPAKGDEDEPADEGAEEEQDDEGEEGPEEEPKVT